MKLLQHFLYARKLRSPLKDEKNIWMPVTSYGRFLGGYFQTRNTLGPIRFSKYTEYSIPAVNSALDNTMNRIGSSIDIDVITRFFWKPFWLTVRNTRLELCHSGNWFFSIYYAIIKPGFENIDKIAPKECTLTIWIALDHPIGIPYLFD